MLGKRGVDWMTWWQPLLEIYEQHLLKCHLDRGDSELLAEYYMKEQYLIYENFRHAQKEYITCDFCTTWSHRFTINFDLLIGEEE